METDNNLVVMYIEGSSYDFSGTKVTIKSLREHYSGEIHVIVKDVDDKLIDFLQNREIKIIYANNYKVLYKTSPYNNKIIYIYLYLMEQKNILENYNIFYCDITDVYFRINPFSLNNTNLWFSLEDKKIGECDTNSAWCLYCYDKNILESIKDYTVINSGLIKGNYSQILNLYKLMLEEMVKIFSKINYPITDQIIVNKIVYLDKLPCILDDINVNNLAQGVKIDINNINHQYKVVKKIKEDLYKQYN